MSKERLHTWWCPRCRCEPSGATNDECCEDCGATLTTDREMARDLRNMGYLVTEPEDRLTHRTPGACR